MGILQAYSSLCSERSVPQSAGSKGLLSTPAHMPHSTVGRRVGTGSFRDKAALEVFILGNSRGPIRSLHRAPERIVGAAENRKFKDRSTNADLSSLGRRAARRHRECALSGDWNQTTPYPRSSLTTWPC